jgi:UTP--glucose-1-phosphate uridylyltransferase
MPHSALPDDPRFAGLLRYGFDRALLQSWQDGLAQGRISLQRNLVTSPLLPPPPGTVRDLPADGSPTQRELEQLGATSIRKGELAVVILNGGMATRFGGVVKGIVDVLGPGRSFLQLAMQDIARMQRHCGGRIQVFLMNSYATEAATKAHFERHHHFGLDPSQIHHFNQFVSVRLEKNGAIFTTQDGAISPYGPGHGDFPSAFRHSGALKSLLALGGKHVMVRNVDNLGARVSPLVLGHHIHSQCAVTCELVPKHKGDVGGAPYLLDGKVQLVEQIRYPQGFDASIVDVFNCNTFTFRAADLDREFDLGWYYVEKSADGRKAVQMEHLIGELTRELPTNWLRVPRQGSATRFLAVKTPEDLDAVRTEVSALYPD